MKAALLAAVIAAAAACRSVPFRFEAQRRGPVSLFRLVAASGARINARLKPSLELADGTVLRFDSPRLSADSAYFADSPVVRAALPAQLRRGLVRASVCPKGEKVCRSYQTSVRW